MASQINNNDDYFNTDHLKSGLKGKAMRGAGATIFASAASFFIQFFSTVILARLLTPNDFGLITMVTTFSLLLQNFGGNGFTEVIIQRENINHKIMSTLFWLNATTSAVLTILFILIAPVLAWFYKEPRLDTITIGVALSIIAGGMSTLHMAILRRNMQFYITSGIGILATLLGISAAIILAWTGWGYWALVANTVLQPLTVTLCGWIFCRWRPGKPTSIKEIIPILKFALNTYGNFTLNYFSRNVDKLLIGWRYAAQSLGYYKKAYDLFALPANQLVSPLANVALAALSRLINDPDKYRRYYLEAISIIAFIGMPISAMFTLTGEDIILLVLGPQWTKAGEIFCYFGTSIGIMFIYGTQGWLHLSLGRPDRWFRWGVFEAITTSLFFIAGLPFGIAGVAIGYSLSFFILVGPCLRYAGKPIDLQLSAIISAIWRYFTAALAAGLLSFVILHKIYFVVSIFSHLHVFFRIILASTLCLTMYLILIILFYQSLNPIKNFFSTAHQMLPDRIQKK
ncbi:MAG: lipopolysaccharide biosynthesis protein [Smithella sp.]|jgi:PST family polysaccharide transporter